MPFHLVSCESPAPFTCGLLHVELIWKSAQYGPQMFIWRVICCWCCINVSVLVDWPSSDLLSPGNSRKLCWTFNCKVMFFALRSLYVVVQSEVWQPEWHLRQKRSIRWLLCHIFDVLIEITDINWDYKCIFTWLLFTYCPVPHLAQAGLWITQ